MTQSLKDSDGIKILLVEGNSVNQEAAIHMLRNMGYSVDVVNNGKLALKELTSHNYHKVLMAFEMPVMNGYKTTWLWSEIERQQQREPIPIIALTAHAADVNREKCIDCGMNDFLSKPFDLINFSEKVSSWLFRTHSNPQVQR